MRVLFLSWYNHRTYHRKVELLADAPDVELLHIIHQDSGIEPGLHPSANGLRTYTARLIPKRQLGRPGDPHRMVYLAAGFYIRQFKPELIQCDDEQESLAAAQIALAHAIWAPRVPLVLFSWQNILRNRSLPVRMVGQFTLRSAQYLFCGNQEAMDVLRRQGYRQGASVVPMMGLDARYFYPMPADRDPVAAA